MWNTSHNYLLYSLYLYTWITLDSRYSRKAATLLSTRQIFHILSCVSFLTYWNILQLSYKATSSEEIDKNNQVVVYSISEITVLLVLTGKYGTINTTDTTTMGYYVIKCMSESYILQEETTCDGQISTSGDLVVKPQYMNNIKNKTKFS